MMNKLTYFEEKFLLTFSYPKQFQAYKQNFCLGVHKCRKGSLYYLSDSGEILLFLVSHWATSATNSFKMPK